MESFELNIYDELSAITLLRAYKDIKIEHKDEDEERLKLERSLEDESQDVDRSRDRSRDQIKESKLERAMRKEREALERDYNEDRMLI